MEGDSNKHWKEFQIRGFDQEPQGTIPPSLDIDRIAGLPRGYNDASSSPPTSASTFRSVSSAEREDDSLFYWLHEFHMEEYHATFVKNDITLDLLKFLSASDLKELIFKVGDRIRIKKAIDQINDDGHDHAGVHWATESPDASVTPFKSSFSGELLGASPENPEFTPINTPISERSDSERSAHISASDQDEQSAEHSSSPTVTVTFVAKNGKYLHMDVTQDHDIISHISRSAKIPTDEKFVIDDGFDIYLDNESLKNAIFANDIREFWINPPHKNRFIVHRGLPTTSLVGSELTTGTSLFSTKPQPLDRKDSTSSTIKHSKQRPLPLKPPPKLKLAENSDRDTDTLTLSSTNSESSERPTSTEVARNITQFFPGSKQEILEEGLRNSIMLNRRFSTVAGTDWRNSRRFSERMSVLSQRRSQYIPAIGKDVTVRSQNSLPEEVVTDELQELDSEMDLLQKLDHEEMCPTKWIKGKLIGSGSFGSVYLAFNIVLGDFMAVKQVPTSILDKRQKKMFEALQNETEVLRKLTHENIVQYKGFKKEAEFFNIFLEYVPGGSLASKLAFFGSFDEDKVRHYISQCLAGLAYLHGEGYIHRDIKSANVLVDTLDRVKISDFGMSKHEDAAKDRKSTQGTVYWMAPEIANAKQQTTTKADIWSLGCMIIELISGQHPYPSLETTQAMFQVGSGKGPPIPESTSPKLREVLSKCLVVDIKERASAKDILKLPFFSVSKS